MNKNYSSEHSETDWEYIKNLQDNDIDLSDIPEITEEQMAKAVLRIVGESAPKGKIRVNMYLDAEIVAFFKAKAGGRGYQTLINDTLRENVGSQSLEKLLRRVIRDELASAT